MFKYLSPIGLFTIKIATNGKYALIFENKVLDYYDSAVAAADNVYMHVTGLFDWDALDGEIDDVPTDIYEWNND